MATGGLDDYYQLPLRAPPVILPVTEREGVVEWSLSQLFRPICPRTPRVIPSLQTQTQTQTQTQSPPYSNDSPPPPPLHSSHQISPPPASASASAAALALALAVAVAVAVAVVFVCSCTLDRSIDRARVEEEEEEEEEEGFEGGFEWRWGEVELSSFFCRRGGGGGGGAGCYAARLLVPDVVGLLLWNQTRQQWVGNRRHNSQRQQPREPKISWNATYESLLGSTKPFPQAIPLGEMVDFLVDGWEQEGLYD
uniref:Gag1-like clamp domain-containing protein n=1 Tax=Oryza glumipatula TaxID=40148 RepID=A0A0D9YNW0_9ORYZ